VAIDIDLVCFNRYILLLGKVHNESSELIRVFLCVVDSPAIHLRLVVNYSVGEAKGKSKVSLRQKPKDVGCNDERHIFLSFNVIFVFG